MRAVAGHSCFLGFFCALAIAVAGRVVAQPVVGEPFDVAEHVYRPFDGPFASPALGFSNGQYLLYASGTFVRVLADGTVLDRPERVLSGAECGEARIFSEGNGWEVWCLGTARRYSVSASGAVTATFDLSATHGIDELHDIDRNGTVWLAAWETGGDDSDVMGALLDAQDDLVGGTAFAIASAAREQHQPTIAVQGSGFLVAYADDRYTDLASEDVRITSVSATGAVGTTDGLPIADAPVDYEQYPKLIAGPTGPLLVYWRAAPSAPLRYEAMHLDANGEPTESPRALATGAWGVPVSGYFDGADHVVLMRASNALTSVIKVGATSVALFNVAPNDPSIASAITGDGAGGGMVTFIRGSWLANPFSPLGPGAELLVVGKTNELIAQAMGGSGAGYLAIYNEVLNSASSDVGVRAVGLDFEGRPLAAPVILQYQPSYAGGFPEVHEAHLVARPDGNYLVTYTAPSNRIVRAVLDPLGNPARPASNSLMLSNAYSPRLSASDSSALFVVNWNGGVYWQRWDFDGVPLDPSLTPVTTVAGNAARRGEVATRGDVHFIVWEDQRQSATNGVDIYGLPVRDTGELVSDDALPIVVAADDQTEPAVVATDDGWLVAWTNEGSSFSLRTVNEAGVLGSIATHGSGTGRAAQLMLASNDSHALVAWMSPDGDGRRIDARLLTLEGDAAGDLVSILVDDTATATLASLAATRREFLVSYDAYDATAHAERVFHRRILFGTALGTACDDDDDCDGTCDDGVCCGTYCGDAADDCLACSAAAGAPYDGACTLLDGATVCRPAIGDCDVAELCTGEENECPDDTHAPDETSCGDLDVCDGEELCYSGLCTSSDPLDCDDENACTTDVCDDTRGCQSTLIADCMAAEPEPDAGSELLPDAGTSTGGSGDSDAGGAGGSGGSGGGDPVGHSGAGGAQPQAGGGAGSNAGTSGMSSAGDSAPTGSNAGCGCSVVGYRRARLDLLIAFVLLLALTRWLARTSSRT